MKKFFLYSACLTLTLGIPAFLGIVLSFTTPPLPREEIVQIITIPAGTSLHALIHQLHEKSIIRSQAFFSLLIRCRRADTKIKSGEYQFTNRMSLNEVLNKLIRGQQIKYSITIPEGLNLVQIAELFARAGLADKDKFLSLTRDPDFISSLGMEETTLEGYLFPDTYRFIRNTGERNIIRTMVQRFNEIYSPQFAERAQEINLSRREVVTLASLIEKETGVSYERPLISGVFHNRLKLNMRLQCDPTVIFGLENFSGTITKEDLKTWTPYNTYLFAGLPPTPIASPGLGSIKAALYPADVPYLYFVSQNDGTHYFSSTLAEHNLAVNMYQRKEPQETPE